MSKNKIIETFITLMLGILLVCVFIAFYSKEPLKTLKTFFTISFHSSWYFGNMLDCASLLLLSSIGVCFAFKTGLFNLGGEGQIYLAAFLTSILLESSSNFSPFMYSFLVLFFVSFVLVFIGFVIGLLKAFYDIDEMIASFLVSSSLAPILNYLILARMKEGGNLLIATKKINEVFELHSLLPPSTFNISFFITILICITIFLFFSKTKIGYHFNTSGVSKEFATFAGFNVKASQISGMCFSCFTNALTGYFAVIGTYKMCHIGFSHGFGWGGIVIALIARQNILLLIPSSLLYAWLENASQAITAKALISFDVSIFFSAIIFFFISANIIKIHSIFNFRSLKNNNMH